MIRPTALLLLIWTRQVYTGNATFGESCSQSNNRLQVGTYQFYSDCDLQTYCAANSTCAYRGCRVDDFPFGYSQDSQTIPPKCPRGQFCPDEMDSCQPILAVGSSCQLNRDDQCQGPPNFKELADHSNRGLNVNGSVCLNNICVWANVTLDEDCVVENTAYIAYTASGEEFIDIVSRGNCRRGLYCDSQKKKCLKNKNDGDRCEADKECHSMNCLNSGFCGKESGASFHLRVWVYVVVAFGIATAIFGTLLILFLVHRRQRDIDREKRVQYWREQNALHQNLNQMREAARASILSLPSGANNPFRDGNNSDESHTPMVNRGNSKL